MLARPRRFTPIAAVALATIVAVQPVLAQEHQHPAAPADTDHESHLSHDLFPAFESSGTSWAPATTPMAGTHRQAGAWRLMLHGSLFLQYLDEVAPIHRGARQAGSINWFMVRARRPLAGGRAGARTMISLEPLTIPGCGYPDLLATGELCDGDGLHDRQHPHDLFMEVAAEFERPFRRGGTLAWHVYGGPAGEPALGPPAFPHRSSAMPNPVAPIGHHWLDATHITFGVVTAGLSGRRWRAEASAFNGREPDERRYGFDLAPLDSFAGRLTFRPHATVAIQVSGGRLESAEQEFAGGARYDIARVTASASYERATRTGRPLAAMLAWGSNLERSQRTHAALLEGSLGLTARDVVFVRGELNSKPAHALHIHEQPLAILTVGKIQGGYTRFLHTRAGLQMGLGGALSAALVPPSIQPNYGGVGVGVGLFALVRSAAR
jgi:hypothetical protein